MKKLLRNIISITLLVFYLTGFCGLTLLKHSCFACQENDYHVVYDLDNCGDEMHVCHADPKSHIFASSEKNTGAYFDAIPCCTLELIYLKNYPKSLLNQSLKSPLTPSIDLFLNTDLHLCHFVDASIGHKVQYAQKIIDPPKITQNLLCCYRC